MSLPFAVLINLFSIPILFQAPAMTRPKISRQGLERKEADLGDFEIVFSTDREVRGKEKDVMVASPLGEIRVRPNQAQIV